MSTREDRRAESLGRIARHLLEVGLSGAGLRSLAAAAGVSDRMLLYYFANKDEVLTLALGMLATDMASALDRSVPPAPKRGLVELRRDIRDAVRGPELKAFMCLWLEIASRASRNVAPYDQLARIIAEGFQSWISARLRASHDGEAALLLATVEGIVVLDAIGRGDVADSAVIAGKEQ